MEEVTNAVVIINQKMPDDRSSGTLLNVSKNEFLLIAGGNREKTFNDIWQLKIDQIDGKFTATWNEVNTNGNTFQPRFGTCGLKVNLEEEKNTLWIHGGQNFFEAKHYADMLELEINSNNSELISCLNHTIYPLNNLTTPRERNSHCIVNNNNELYLFGGGSQEGLLNDLWSFNPINKKWTKHDYNSESIPSREMHGSVAYTNKNGENFIYIFGGRLYESIDNKIYRINLSNLKCECLGEMPTPLCSFSYTVFKHFIVIYGGTDGITFINDIIIYNIITQKWAKSKVQINSDFIDNDANLIAFLGRIGSMMSLDPVTENLIIFGGSSLHKDTNYTFVINMNELLDENKLIPIKV